MNKSERDSSVLRHPSIAQLTVRLDALLANYREIIRRAAPAHVAPVIKADAYSLGMRRISTALSAAGADSFFVARLDEGIALRVLLPEVRIFVLDGVGKGAAPALIAHRLIPVLNAPEEVSEWSREAVRRKTVLDAALQIDTGMNRSGLAPAEVSQLAPRVADKLTGINLVLIMSHLACADEPEHRMNRMQLERFRAALALLPSAPASLAASAGIELGKDYLFDGVRPGLGVYGGNPVPSKPNPYRTVAGLTGYVLQVRKIARGDTVGYGAGFTAKRATALAIVATGYADGLFRSAGTGGYAAIAGVRVPFAGRISMDLVALDATDVPAVSLFRGAEVEFLGDTIRLEDAAAAAGTIAHEVLTSIAPRARRVYLDE